MQLCPRCHRGVLRPKMKFWSLLGSIVLLFACFPLAMLILLTGGGADFYQCDNCGFTTPPPK